MQELTNLHKEILVECSEDDVGLWSVIWRVNGGWYSKDEPLPEGVRKKTIEILRDLLEAGLIHAGFPSRDGKVFEALSLSASETIDRINREWDELGRPPDMGEIIWFKSTPEGKHVAQEIMAQGERSWWHNVNL